MNSCLIMVTVWMSFREFVSDYGNSIDEFP